MKRDLWLITLLAIVGLMPVGCQGDGGSLSGGVDLASPDIGSWITDDLLDRLDSVGRFVTPPPVSHLAILAPDEAVDLAAAFVHEYVVNAPATRNGAESMRASIEARYGAPIDFMEAVADVSPLFVESPFDSFPPPMPESLKRWIGPWYVVRFSVGGIPSFSVAVSARSTHLQIDDGGRIRFPARRGNEFRVMGTPSGGSLTVPMTAEQAVAVVGRATGSRIVEAPRAFRAALPPEFPQLVRWRAVLEDPAQVRYVDDGSLSRTREIFVLTQAPRGMAESLFFVREPPPEGGVIQYPSPEEDGLWYSLQVADARPAIYRRVEILPF